MKRKIYKILLEWKNRSAGTSAIMLDGARRVGKSYIAEEFAKREYESYLLIDFATVTKDVFDRDAEKLYYHYSTN